MEYKDIETWEDKLYFLKKKQIVQTICLVLVGFKYLTRMCGSPQNLQLAHIKSVLFI